MMYIDGFQKTTLLDYPGHIAATIFLGGCNFRCPFCHNADLVLRKNSSSTYTKEDILTFLKKRKNILQGVCISGGEPTIYPELISFLAELKELDYLVKLDTNGTNPDLLKKLYQEKLIQYVAMDIKADEDNYPLLCGLNQWNNDMLSKIKESIHFLIHETNALDFSYEFRTTCVSPLHSEQTFLHIGSLIEGAKQYYLQSYQEQDSVLYLNHPNYPSSFDRLSSFSKEELLHFASLVKPHVRNVSLRGIN